MNCIALVEAEQALDSGRVIARAAIGHSELTAIHHEADLWVSLGPAKRKCGLAWRAPLFSPQCKINRVDSDDHLLVFEATSELGRHRITIDRDPAEACLLTLEVVFKPSEKLHVPFLPRDLVVLGSAAGAAKGKIDAQQRRLNTGLCYFDVDEPDLGKVLYVQDFTRLNAYFRATGTDPENAVGGLWPEVGYLAPTRPDDASKALPAGQAICLNRAFILIRRFPRASEEASAWQFLDMLGAVYQRLDHPEPDQRDWIDRGKRTLQDLRRSPKARTRHFGEVYFHPYTAAEYPDSMVQLSILAAVHEWGRWQGRRDPLERQIARGIGRFRDAELATLRRYLPDVGADKDADAVDSWYLYRPLASLADLAIDGEEWARELFFAVVDFGIRAARHFAYKWPIQFKVDTFKVITPVAADDLGQTDVGGMYAWVMLQAYELSGEQRFVDEARAAIDAAKGMRFHLNYQANLTAWGAAACMRLWRMTGKKDYLGQSYVYLASFFHNSQMWRSRIALAEHYSNFMAVTCLQDAPYMAIYECFDSFAAFERYLDLGGPDLIPAAKLLVNEYCRYALDRAWYYYPDALPPDALATGNRNGHIDRALSFPLEDLYPDGQPAGQVGQEIYGSGAAMVFATRAFHRLEGTPLLLFCDHFVRALTHPNEGAASFVLDGSPGVTARIALSGPASARRAAVLRDACGATIKPEKAPPGLREIRFKVPAQGHYTLGF